MQIKMAPGNLAAGGFSRQGSARALGQAPAPPSSAAPPSTSDVKEGFRKIRALVPVMGAASVAGLVVSAAATWVGYETGKRQKGFLSATGYGVAAVGVLSGLGSLAALWGTTVAGGVIDRAEDRATKVSET
jgi:hypothetical protein